MPHAGDVQEAPWITPRRLSSRSPGNTPPSRVPAVIRARQRRGHRGRRGQGRRSGEFLRPVGVLRLVSPRRPSRRRRPGVRKSATRRRIPGTEALHARDADVPSAPRPRSHLPRVPRRRAPGGPAPPSDAKASASTSRGSEPRAPSATPIPTTRNSGERVRTVPCCRRSRVRRRQVLTRRLRLPTDGPARDPPLHRVPHAARGLARPVAGRCAPVACARRLGPRPVVQGQGDRLRRVPQGRAPGSAGPESQGATRRASRCRSPRTRREPSFFIGPHTAAACHTCHKPEPRTSPSGRDRGAVRRAGRACASCRRGAIAAPSATGAKAVTHRSRGRPPHGRFTTRGCSRSRAVTSTGRAPAVTWRRHQGDADQVLRLPLDSSPRRSV